MTKAPTDARPARAGAAQPDHSHHDHHHGPGHHNADAGGAVSEESYPHVRGGPQVLDIGGDIGALEATMNPDSAGTELHLISEHQPPVQVHTGIWHRTQAENPLTTALFPELVEGTYWVLNADGTPTSRVVITGGELTRIDLRR